MDDINNDGYDGDYDDDYNTDDIDGDNALKLNINQIRTRQSMSEFNK